MLTKRHRSASHVRPNFAEYRDHLLAPPGPRAGRSAGRMLLRNGRSGRQRAYSHLAKGSRTLGRNPDCS